MMPKKKIFNIIYLLLFLATLAGTTLLFLHASVKKYDYAGYWLSKKNISMYIFQSNQSKCDYYINYHGGVNFWCFNKAFFSNALIYSWQIHDYNKEPVGKTIKLVNDTLYYNDKYFYKTIKP
jgi:hypothetical protein